MLTKEFNHFPTPRWCRDPVWETRYL